MPDMEFRAAAERGQAAMIDFAQRLMTNPQPVGQERAVADLVQAEMERLGYDEVWRDEAGNVIGADPRHRARRPAPPHHVQHPHGPGGRGRPRRAGPTRRLTRPSPTARSGGGAPATSRGRWPARSTPSPRSKRWAAPCPTTSTSRRWCRRRSAAWARSHLAHTVHCDYCILGEPTTNRLMRGHRGRVELEVASCGAARSTPACPRRASTRSIRWPASCKGWKSLPMVERPGEPRAWGRPAWPPP